MSKRQFFEQVLRLNLLAQGIENDAVTAAVVSDADLRVLSAAVESLQQSRKWLFSGSHFAKTGVELPKETYVRQQAAKIQEMKEQAAKEFRELRGRRIDAPWESGRIAGLQSATKIRGVSID